MPKISAKTIIYIAIGIGLLVAMFMLCSPKVDKKESTPDEIVSLFKNDGGYIKITEDKIEYQPDRNTKYTADTPEDFDPTGLVPGSIGSGQQLEIAEGEKEKEGNSSWTTILLTYLPFVLLIVLVIFFIRRMGSRQTPIQPPTQQ